MSVNFETMNQLMALTAYYVGGADGKFDEEEREKAANVGAEMLSDGSFMWSDCASSFMDGEREYDEIKNNIHTGIELLNELHEDRVKIFDNLKVIRNQLLPMQDDPEEVDYQLLRFLLSYSTHIAYASGGSSGRGKISGKEKKAMIQINCEIFRSEFSSFTEENVDINIDNTLARIKQNEV